jgi:hypothetical protein
MCAPLARLNGSHGVPPGGRTRLLLAVFPSPGVTAETVAEDPAFSATNKVEAEPWASDATVQVLPEQEMPWALGGFGQLISISPLSPTVAVQPPA